MANHQLRILHLSDLHERVALPWMEVTRKRKIELGEAGRGRVLETNFFDVLSELQCSSPIDIVCFTGDIADWGLPEEYVQAEKFIRRILEVVQVPIERFFLVPGNHDIQRRVENDSWIEMRSFFQERPDDGSLWMGGMDTPRGAQPEWCDAVLKRTRAFWDWVELSLGRSSLCPGESPHKRLGYRHKLDIDFPFPIHIIGLDSAWLCGDNNDCQKLYLTKHQIDMLTCDGRKHLDGFRLAMLHHPLTDLADRYPAQHLLAETVDLLIHGHQHVPVLEEHKDPDRKLLSIAAGSLYEGDSEDKWVNAFHLINVQLNDKGRPLQYDVEFWAWSERGHWHPDGALYRMARDGRYTWLTSLGKITCSDTQRLSTATDTYVADMETTLSSDCTHRIAAEANKRRLEPPPSEVLSSLVDKIKELVKAFSYQETVPFAVALENHLKTVKPKGAVVRDGWITLAQIEQHNLWVAKQSGLPVNLTRLQALYQEAQNVVD